jgi:hypothetical protein
MPEISNDEIRYKILEVLYKIALREGSDWKVKRPYLKNKLKIDQHLIDFNVKYLNDRGLARIIVWSGRNWDSAVITAKGIDVYEHKSDFANQYPFMKVAIQNIGGNVYGSAVQSVDSQISFDQRIIDSFKQAYSLVELEKNVSEEQKIKIKDKLGELEEEIKSGSPDKSKVHRLWFWIKDNASWAVPALMEIIEIVLKTCVR